MHNQITVELEVDYEQATDITYQVLVNSLENIEFFNSIDDVPLWDAMNEVIAYFCTPEQLRELELRTVRPEWMLTVLQYDNEKLTRMGY